MASRRGDARSHGIRYQILSLFFFFFCLFITRMQILFLCGVVAAGVRHLRCCSGRHVSRPGREGGLRASGEPANLGRMVSARNGRVAGDTLDKQAHSGNKAEHLYPFLQALTVSYLPQKSRCRHSDRDRAGWVSETRHGLRTACRGQAADTGLGSGRPAPQHRKGLGPSTGTCRESAGAVTEEDNSGGHHSKDKPSERKELRV